MRDFVPYPPIGRHGVIGDRRTAALVAADGTIGWLCLCDYDHDPVFASLVDARRGGWWRVGPALPTLGRQRYLDGSAVLQTSWSEPGGTLELTDAMAWPQDERPHADEPRRVVLRRLRASEGEVECSICLSPRDMLVPDLTIDRADGGLVVRMFGRRKPRTLGVWCSHPLVVEQRGTRASARLRLSAGESVWMVLAADESPARWSVQAAEGALDATLRCWRDWLARFDLTGEYARPLERSLVTLHLLGYAPSGAMVAAPSLGLPERIGGPRNYDYRYAWIRDASLSVSGLSMMGDAETPERYLGWLSDLGSRTRAPLQVLYGVRGTTRIRSHRWRGALGYRESAPLTIGNRAYAQRQIGSLGYVAECMWVTLESGMGWRAPYSRLLARLARHVAETWEEPDSGIWEVQGKHQHFIASKVMSWVVMDRAVRIARRAGGFDAREMERWRDCADRIRAWVLDEGFDPTVGAFVQRRGHRTLDASVLLVSITGLLPADDPRVLSTLDRLDETLGLDGFLYRFEPTAIEGERPLPVGEYEGAFLPCTFWMARARASAGRIDSAREILEHAQRAAGELGLYPEEIDPRTGEALGNYPLLFSHVEHVRSIHAIENAVSSRQRGRWSRRSPRDALASGEAAGRREGRSG